MRAALLSVLICIIFACDTRKASSQNHQKPIALDSSKTYQYNWLPEYSIEDKLINRITLPGGYERLQVSAGSFGGWLRNLPMKKGRPDVLLYNGNRKFNQRAQCAVVDIDVGDKDLQQCADAVMRLRAEYLYASQRFDDIQFNFTNGFTCDFATWSQGNRPVVNGNRVSWSKQTSAARDYATFRKYLERIFMYCGTHSLSKEMKSASWETIQPGDVFIQGGFPGHAVIVVDVAVHRDSGERIFLLAQSYMPAQDIHVLVNPNDASLSPWYSTTASGALITPEWTFQSSDLKTF